MSQREALHKKLAELGALRIVQERDEVVGFLRTRTNRFVPNDIDNQSIANILVDMVFSPDEQEKSIKLIVGEDEYLNVAGIVIVGLVLTAIGSTASVVKGVRVSQEARESAISGLTQEQIDLDKQMLENRKQMSQAFLTELLRNEQEVQEKTRAALASERQQKIIYLLIFIAILVTAFSLIINKK